MTRKRDTDATDKTVVNEYGKGDEFLGQVENAAYAVALTAALLRIGYRAGFDASLSR